LKRTTLVAKLRRRRGADAAPGDTELDGDLDLDTETDLEQAEPEVIE
jgi:hypothetical protein